MEIIYKKKDRVYDKIVKAINEAMERDMRIESIKLTGSEYRALCFELEDMSVTGLYGTNLADGQQFSFWGIEIINKDYQWQQRREMNRKISFLEATKDPIWGTGPLYYSMPNKRFGL